MQNVIYTLVIFLNIATSTAQTKRPTKNKAYTMVRIDLTIFNEKQVAGHVRFIMKDGTIVEQWESKGKYYLEEKTKLNTNYSTYKMFFYDTKTLEMAGEQFYRMKIGTWRKYDKMGKIVEQTNHETLFPFTLENLNAKMHKIGIDIMVVDNAISVLRSESPKPTYTVVMPSAPDNNIDKRIIIVDGISGKTLSDEIGLRTK